ncbi:MAG: zinc-dependent metalloprotease [Actinomycetota bacterium]|nr:zinc-dependent metalloprotease [Actinomycetota bacterium]
MSPDVPEGMGGFFPNMLGDLLKMLRTDSPIQWDLALQLAQSVASEGASEPNVDPMARMRFEEYVRIAELQVAAVIGMSVNPSGRSIGVVAVNRTEWARRALESWRWLILDIARALNPGQPATGAELASALGASLSGGSDQDLSALLAQWASAMAPAMIAMQVGSVVGHLARQTLGQYELPLPWRDSAELVVVPGNVAEFVESWSLQGDDATLWLAVRDVATHAVMSRPHVAERLARLLVAHAAGFRPDPQALEQRLSEAAGGELSDLGDLTRLLGDPSALAEVNDSPELRRIKAELDALSAVLGGYVEWVTDSVAGKAIAGRSAVREAMRRRRVERTSEARAAEALFGLALDVDQVDRGEAFVRGVLERGGEVELAKLWVVEANLPTPAEVDAPGLWIERVNLPAQKDR